MIPNSVIIILFILLFLTCMEASTCAEVLVSESRMFPKIVMVTWAVSMEMTRLQTEHSCVYNM